MVTTRSGVEVQADWDQIPRNVDRLSAEECRPIIVDRDIKGYARDDREVCAIVADANTDESLTYRKGLVSIRESEWNALEGRTWENVFLA